MFHPHSNEWLLNKFEFYKELRSRDVAYYSEEYGLHLLTRYDDVKFALGNAEVFSSAQGNLIVESPSRFGRTLGASDAPLHDTLKGIVRDAYSKENISRVAKCITRHADELLSGDTLHVSEIAEQLSAWVVAEMLNMPYVKQYSKRDVKDLIFEVQRTAPMATNQNPDETKYVEMVTFFLYCIESKIPGTGPGIYREAAKHKFGLSKTEDRVFISLLTGPAISGASSLTGALEFLTLDLYRQNQLDELLTHPELIPNAVNESLRFNASTGRFSRTVTRDIEMHGVKLKAGDRVALCLESANRDETVFTDPEKFDLHRDTRGSLGFGYGAHACIALAISKALMAAYLKALLTKVGKYKVTTENLQYFMTSSGNDDMITNIVIEKINGESAPQNPSVF